MQILVGMAFLFQRSCYFQTWPNFPLVLCYNSSCMIFLAINFVLFPQTATAYVSIDYLQSQFLVLGRALGLNEKSKNIFLCTQ